MPSPIICLKRGSNTTQYFCWQLQMLLAPFYSVDNLAVFYGFHSTIRQNKLFPCIWRFPCKKTWFEFFDKKNQVFWNVAISDLTRMVGVRRVFSSTKCNITWFHCFWYIQVPIDNIELLWICLVKYLPYLRSSYAYVSLFELRHSQKYFE